MIGAGSYILSAAALAALALSLSFTAVRLRRRLLSDWEGAPAHLVEIVIAVALLIWLSELLGAVGALYAWTLVASSVLLAALSLWLLDAPPAGGAGRGGSRTPPPAAPPSPRDRPRGPGAWELLVMTGVIALVVAHWALTTKGALDRGIFNFDSLWYHMPFAADIAQSHSVIGLHHTETVFTNWFYPQNSELLHADGILLVHRDTLSLFLNFGWLGVAFLSAWVIGRPYGRGHLGVAAVAILLECHTLVVREPGAAKNDLAAAALLLAAVAILVSAWSMREGAGERRSLPVGWPLAAAGLAVGLAAGTKLTVLAMAAALTAAVVFLAPRGRRTAAAAWWFVPAFLAGGFWYLRNLIAAGNPIPQVAHLGPIALPHPERLQTARPDFNIAHYATDTGVWSHYFAPGLHEQFGSLWPLVLVGAAVAALAALIRGRNVLLRWLGGIALFGMVAYLFTPLGAAGADGAPVAFEINVRYLVPALLLAMALLPLARAFDGRRPQLALLAGLVVVLVVTDGSEAVARDPDRVFAVLFAVLVVLVPAGLLLLRQRGAPAAAIGAGFAALALALVAIGYPVQRDYLTARFANTGTSEERIPGENLDSAYRWARDVGDSRIGLAGTTAGFLGYGFYGTDLSNRVVYLGEDGPNGAFDPIPTCEKFRAALNDADLDYLVTSPFLNFIHTEDPISSPEAGWLRNAKPSSAIRPILHSGPVTVWRIQGPINTECGPGAVSRIPNTPDS